MPTPNSTVSGSISISISSINLGRGTAITYRNDPRNKLSVSSALCPISTTPVTSSDSVGFKSFIVGFGSPLVNTTTSVNIQFITAVDLPAYGALSIQLENCVLGNNSGPVSFYGRDLNGGSSDIFDFVYVLG